MPRSATTATTLRGGRASHASGMRIAQAACRAERPRVPMQARERGRRGGEVPDGGALATLTPRS